MQRQRGRWVGAVLGAALWCVVSGAVAQENAQSLYDEGLKDMLAERYGAGCPKLQRSYELDPLPGALFTLAACYARWGKVHTAVLRYQEFMRRAEQLPEDQRAKQADRLLTAGEKLAALRPQVPTLTLAFATPPPPGVTVDLDGERVQPSALGTPLPVDPGEHRVTVKTSGGLRKDYVEYVVAGEGKQLDLELPAAGAAPEPEPEEEEGGGPSLRTWAFVAGGVGVAGLLVGGITGGLVLGKKGDVEDNCVEEVCNQAGLDAVDEAETLAMVSNIGFAVGIAGLAAGVVLWFVAPDEEPTEEVAGLRLSVGGAAGDPTSATVGVRGTW